MGNAQSDQGEKEAWEWIKIIPVVNAVYAPIRAAVYQGKKNNDEAKRSGLDMASALVDTATVFVPGLNVVKGAHFATRVAIKAGTIVAASTVQSGLEYGIAKGRQEVDEGKFTFKDPITEVRKGVSFIPGGTLAVDLIRTAQGEEVEAGEWLEGAATMTAWAAPVPRSYGAIDKKLRHTPAKVYLPDRAGKHCRLAKGEYKKGLGYAAVAGECAQQGLFNTAEKGIEYIPLKDAAQDEKTSSGHSATIVPDTVSDEPDTISIELAPISTSDHASVADQLSVYATPANITLLATAIAVTAVGSYLVHRRVRSNRQTLQESQVTAMTHEPEHDSEDSPNEEETLSDY